MLKFAAERSVLAPAFTEWRDMIRAGDRQKDEALARLTMGSGPSALAVSAALEGKASGAGPSAPLDPAALGGSGGSCVGIGCVRASRAGRVSSLVTHIRKDTNEYTRQLT